MLITGNAVDDNGIPVLDAWYYRSDSNGAHLSDNVFMPQGTFAIDIDPTDNNTFYRWARPGYTDWHNQPYGNGGYLAANNPLTLIFHNADQSKSLIVPVGIAALLLLATKKKKAVGKMEAKDVYPYLIIAGALMVTGVFKKILTFLGVFDSQATVNVNNASNNPNSFWSPNFYKNYTSFSYALTEQEAINKLLQIESAFGVFSDDVAQVNAVFKSLQTQSEVSYLADVFQQREGSDFLTWLRGGVWPNDRLSDSEINDINTYLSKLPTH